MNLFLIWEREDETWNLLYHNTGPDLIAIQKQEESVKIKLCEHPESRIALNANSPDNEMDVFFQKSYQFQLNLLVL